jgi:hypothetical protein
MCVRLTTLVIIDMAAITAPRRQLLRLATDIRSWMQM